MKKLFIALLTAGALASSALAAPPPPYYVAGDFNGWNAAGNLMTETSAGSGIWQVSLNMSAGRHEFKITEGDWGWNYPGPNSWLYADSLGNISITYDANTYADGWSPTSQRIGESVDPGTWTAAGSFQGWNNAAGNMTPLGGGIYEYTVTTPGSYTWKAVVTGTWDSISWDNRSVATSDWNFTVADEKQAHLYVNALAGTAMVEIVPEPSTLALLGLAAGFCWLRRKQ
jgi:pullulanase